MKGSVTVQLASSLTIQDSNKTVVAICTYVGSEDIESKPVILEPSDTVILPPPYGR